jgi:hypothetical protein
MLGSLQKTEVFTPESIDFFIKPDDTAAFIFGLVHGGICSTNERRLINFSAGKDHHAHTGRAFMNNGPVRFTTRLKF